MSTAAQTRKPGLYWVRLYEAPRWTVARWDETLVWRVIGSSITMMDSHLVEIDERRLERQP